MSHLDFCQSDNIALYIFFYDDLVFLQALVIFIFIELLDPMD